jgi:hypothetical protein
MTAPSTLLTALCALLLSGGCSHQVTAAKIVISEGCLITIEGVSQQQAEDVIRNWDLDNGCQLEVKARSEKE